MNKLIRIISDIIALIIIITAIIGIIITNKNISNNYYLIDNEKTFKSSIKEDNMQALVVNAPITCTPFVDDYKILTQKYDIPADSLVWVHYQKEKCSQYTDSDGDKHTSWNKFDTPYIAYSTSTYLYNDIPLYAPIDAFILKNYHTINHYPNKKGDFDGNIRYSISYITTNDTLTFYTTIGNNSFIIIPQDKDNTQLFINTTRDNLKNNSTLPFFIIIIGTLIIIIFLEGYWFNQIL